MYCFSKSYQHVCYREVWTDHTPTGGVLEGYFEKVPGRWTDSESKCLILFIHISPSFS